MQQFMVGLGFRANVEQILASSPDDASRAQELITNVDWIISTINPISPL